MYLIPRDILAAFPPPRHPWNVAELVDMVNAHLSHHEMIQFVRLTRRMDAAYSPALYRKIMQPRSFLKLLPTEEFPQYWSRLNAKAALVQIWVDDRKDERTDERSAIFWICEQHPSRNNPATLAPFRALRVLTLRDSTLEPHDLDALRGMLALEQIDFGTTNIPLRGRSLLRVLGGLDQLRILKMLDITRWVLTPPKVPYQMVGLFPELRTLEIRGDSKGVRCLFRCLPSCKLQRFRWSVAVGEGGGHSGNVCFDWEDWHWVKNAVSESLTDLQLWLPIPIGKNQLYRGNRIDQREFLLPHLKRFKLHASAHVHWGDIISLRHMPALEEVYAERLTWMTLVFFLNHARGHDGLVLFEVGHILKGTHSMAIPWITPWDGLALQSVRELVIRHEVDAAAEHVDTVVIFLLRCFPNLVKLECHGGADLGFEAMMGPVFEVLRAPTAT
ncbi:hypothetical protein HWV62_21936 [Athelia sp. TMB]|nr:hypothetical protein HWV62_21936 [Athelia sp. TMB]